MLFRHTLLLFLLLYLFLLPGMSFLILCTPVQSVGRHLGRFHMRVSSKRAPFFTLKDDLQVPGGIFHNGYLSNPLGKHAKPPRRCPHRFTSTYCLKAGILTSVPCRWRVLRGTGIWFLGQSTRSVLFCHWSHLCYVISTWVLFSRSFKLRCSKNTGIKLRLSYSVAESGCRHLRSLIFLSR